MADMFDYTLPGGQTMSAPTHLFTPEEIADMQARQATAPVASPAPPVVPTKPAIPPWLGALGAPPPASGMMSQPRPVPPPPPVPQVPVETPAPAPAPAMGPPAGPPQVPGPTPPPARRGGMGGPASPSGAPSWLTQEMQARGEYEPPERPLSPLEQARADEERGFDEQMRAVGDVARGRAEAAQLEAAALEQQNEMRRAQVQAAQAQQQEIEQRTGQLFQQAQDEVRKAGELEVDVDRFWSQRGNFARAMGAIGIALGEQARIWGAPSNAAKEMIDDAIERDIAEQQMAIEQAQWRASAADNALARYAETYGSIPAAREAVKAAMYAQAEGEYRSALLARGVAEEQVLADGTVRDLSGKRDEAMAAAREQMLLAQQMAAQQAMAARAQQRTGLSKGETKSVRAKLIERIQARKKALQDLDAVRKDYAASALNPALGAEERGEARLPVQLMRSAVFRGLQGRTDAPNAEETASVAGTVPDTSSFIGNAMATVGIGGEAGARQGAVTAISKARARIEEAMQQDEAELSALPVE